MALIIYPATNWNTFVSEIEADGFFGFMTDDGGWSTLTQSQKDAHIISTASMIRLCPNITLPKTNEVDLVEGQLHLLSYTVKSGTETYDPNSKYITKEKVGSLEVDYSEGRATQGSMLLPPMAELYLKQYGCSSGGSFSQSKVK